MADYYIKLPAISGGGSGITALTGDVTATGPGSAAATVISAGGGSGTFTAGSLIGNLTGTAFNPAIAAEFLEDWSGANVSGTNNWGVSNGGGGAAATTVDYKTHPGVAYASPESNATGWCYLYSGTLDPSGGAVVWAGLFKLVQLSDGTNRFNIRMGFSDSVTNTLPAQGVWFSYTDSVNSGNWVAHTAQSGITTDINSGIAAVAAAQGDPGGWVTLSFVSTPSLITFYINGTSIGSSSTNLPVGAVYHNWGVEETLGTGTGDKAPLFADYIHYRMIPTGGR